MIPSFDMSGVLPPFVGSSSALPGGRSPYLSTTAELVQRFHYSAPRLRIISGLLNYRQQLRRIGLSSGFQWINGSFVEDVETNERRAPNDIDLVTFVQRPAAVKADAAWNNFTNANAALFQSQQTKGLFNCDAYVVDLDVEPASVVAQTVYWFGLFSHKRISHKWKGMLQIPLGRGGGDTQARMLIRQAAVP